MSNDFETLPCQVENVWMWSFASCIDIISYFLHQLTQDWFSEQRKTWWTVSETQASKCSLPWHHAHSLKWGVCRGGQRRCWGSWCSWSSFQPEHDFSGHDRLRMRSFLSFCGCYLYLLFQRPLKIKYLPINSSDIPFNSNISFILHQFWCWANCFNDRTDSVLLDSLTKLFTLFSRWKNLTLEKRFTNFLVIPGISLTCFQINCWVLNNISFPCFSLCFPWSLLNWTLQTLVISTVSNVACLSFPLDLLAMYDPGVGSVVSCPVNVHIVLIYVQYWRIKTLQ